MVRPTLIEAVLVLTCIARAAPAANPTFYKDVLPILQEHCQECHRTGEIAPMPLLTFAQVRPWAKAIQAAVLRRSMPPWPADQQFGKFSNDLSLTQDQIATLSTWAVTGSPEGKASEAPQPRTWATQWRMGTPDVVLDAPEVELPGSGTIEYQYIVVPTGFTEDQWVQAVEVQPSNRANVHHAIVFVRRPGAKWLADAQPGAPYIAPLVNGIRNLSDTLGGGSEILGVYSPGIRPQVWGPEQARKIEAGSDLVFQMHYTTTGKAAKNRTRIGLVLAKQPPVERIITIPVLNTTFRIPAGDGDYKAVARTPVINPVKIVSLFPHLHVRGKSFQFDVNYPDGHTETLLKLKRWDPNWQLEYRLATPLALPPGSWIQGTAWWDNSANNPSNPEPKVDVTWGEQSWEEMLVGFVQVAVDPRFDSVSVFSPFGPPNRGARSRK